MPAFLKVYTDSGHTTEVAHSSGTSSTLNGATSVGATTISVASAGGWPAQGSIDIDTAGGGGLETVQYTLITGTTPATLTLAKALTLSHLTGVAVVQWYYGLLVGDQTNGIINDGTMATPSSPTNVGTWYLFNAGDQTATGITVATASGGNSTTSGFADTLVSITSVSTGYSASVAPANITAGAAATQFWVVAEIPLGQSSIGNQQVCVINISYASV